jgi:hypothetical protein
VFCHICEKAGSAGLVRAPGLPRLPASQVMTRACMSLRGLDLDFIGSLSALRTCVAQRSAYFRYVMPTFFQVDMMAEACARSPSCAIQLVVAGQRREGGRQARVQASGAPAGSAISSKAQHFVYLCSTSLVLCDGCVRRWPPPS